jgi:hypothetical protein
MDTHDTRRTRVAKLMTDRRLNQRAFGELVEVSEATVSRWFQTGAGRKNIGEKVARRIEDKLGLPRGWLDGIEPTLVTVAEPSSAYNVEPMRLDTLLWTLATHIDTAPLGNRPSVGDLMRQFVLGAADRTALVAAILALVPQPVDDARVANAYGDPKVKSPRGR